MFAAGRDPATLVDRMTTLDQVVPDRAGPHHRPRPSAKTNFDAEHAKLAR